MITNSGATATYYRSGDGAWSSVKPPPEAPCPRWRIAVIMHAVPIAEPGEGTAPDPVTSKIDDATRSLLLGDR